MKSSRRWVILLLGALMLWTAGCYLPLAMGSTSSQVAAPPAPAPTPTPAPPQVQLEAEEPANALEAQVETVYDHAAPAVVNITSRVVAYDFFNQPIPQEGTGSGFVYDERGHIVTNYHVVANAESVTVNLAGGQAYPAEIVGTDPSTDLAVIRIQADDLPKPLGLADSSRLRVGQFVVAIGNPFGLEQTLTLGVISSLGRVIQSPDDRFIGEAIQTDAAINPGNSGGPLLDLKGRVVGVNSQIISPSGASAGIGFAISANTVRRVVPELIARGRYPHPWLGVQIFDVTPERAAVIARAGAELPVQEGVLILAVTPNGPAAKAGLRGGQRIVIVGNIRFPVGGDIIVAIDDTPIETGQELTLYLDTKTQVGQTIRLRVNREGQEIEVPVTLEARPEES